ncbi:MAG: carbohydrate ABC transporter permease [bacterium]|nr:carbohydrate ABC transporter permease [Candidatus Sumerlaeota bacterium]
MKNRKAIGDTIVFLLLLTGALVLLAPLAWMLSTSLKEPGDVFKYPPQWIPRPAKWSNYLDVFTEWPFARYLTNTLWVTGMAMLGTLFSCSFAAYSFARLRWAGRDLIFMISLATMMLPAQVTMVPTFAMFVFTGWIDTLLPLYVPAFFGNAFFIFLFRQFFKGIPLALEDAAKIDGCGYFQTYWHVITPLTRPAFITVAIFTFMGTWNDFLGPLIYISSESKRTLALALSFYQNYFYGGIHLHTLMAASILVLLPCIAVFFVFQKYFIQGMVLSGLKG